MSKELFALMREQEMQDQFPSRNKIKQSYSDYAKQVIDSGIYNEYELYAQGIRAEEAFKAFNQTIRGHLPQENVTIFGVEIKHVTRKDKLNYSDDDVYSAIQEQLKQRKTLLDTAYQSDTPIYDKDGVQVPKVSTTPVKSSITSKF